MVYIQTVKALKAAIYEGYIDEVKSILKENDIPMNECLADELSVPQGPFCEPTVLTLAVDSGHFNVVKDLLEFGGECYSLGKSYWLHKGVPDSFVPLDYFGAMVHAARINRFDIIQLLAEFRILQKHEPDHSFRDVVKAVKEKSFDSLEKYLRELEDKAVALRGWKGHNLMNLLILHQCPSWCIRLLVENGISVTGWDWNGLTPLRCAVLSRKIESVQFLLDNGVDVYSPHVHGDTHFKNDGTCVDDRGIDLSPSAQKLEIRQKLRHVWLYEFGPSTTMYAAAIGDVPILRLILESSPLQLGFHGTRGMFGDSPLNYAVDYGCSESINLMLKYKTVRLSIGDGYTIDRAFRLNNEELFELMLQNVINWDSFKVCTCVHGCISKNKPEYLKRVLKSFNKKFQKEDKGGALHKAIKARSFECARILFGLPGFDINARYKDEAFGRGNRFTALMYASCLGKDDFIQLFLKMGAKVDMTDKYGKTAIMLAALYCNVKCFELLMDANANLDKTTHNGQTVFSFVMRGDGNCLELLLKSGKMIDRKTQKLKLVHKNALDNLGILFENRYHSEHLIGLNTKYSFVRKFTLLMEYDIFEWHLCTKLPVKLLPDIAFAAVTLGISPGMFRTESGKMPCSLLRFAHKQGDKETTRYLIANLYFFPDDYRAMCLESREKSVSEEDCLLEPLLFQPLSLYHWSFLTISKAITWSGSFSKDRGSRVDQLPLPMTVKEELKFKRQYSKLCCRHWHNLGCQSRGQSQKFAIDDLVVGDQVLRDAALTNCTFTTGGSDGLPCKCGGFSLSFDTH